MTERKPSDYTREIFLERIQREFGIDHDGADRLFRALMEGDDEREAVSEPKAGRVLAFRPRI